MTTQEQIAFLGEQVTLLWKANSEMMSCILRHQEVLQNHKLALDSLTENEQELCCRVADLEGREDEGVGRDRFSEN